MSDTFIRAETKGHVGVVRLDRPAKRNALSRTMLDQLVEALQRLDADPAVRAIVVAGHEKAFAAGADIGALAEAGPVELYISGFSEKWDQVAAVATPLIAAVSGYALGGGLELALICDIVIADRSAVFGLPETVIGIIPGAGGTQRLVRSVGKSMAMEMILAGRRLDADEALRAGLVSTVAETGTLLAYAEAMAERIARSGPLAVALAKSAVLASFDQPLSSGIRYERVLSALLSASQDRGEGLRAFQAKREPVFRGI